MNLSTIERLDSQLDQQLMHTPRSHCEIFATLLVNPGVLLFDRSRMNAAAVTCSKLTMALANGVVLVSLLVTLNIFYTLF